MTDIIIISILAILVCAAVWQIRRRKKEGCGCGCGCAGCSRAGMCYPEDTKNIKK